MPLKTFTSLAVAAIMTAGIAVGVTAQDQVVDPAIAAMSPEQLVEAREAKMKQNGGILRNAGSLSGADAVAAADTMIQNFTDLPAMFPEGSAVGESRALPIIWEEKDAFTAIFDQARAIVVDMRAAAEAGDAAAFGAGAQQLGGLCGQCHDKYRAAS